MTYLFWTLVVLHVLDIAGRCYCLGAEVIPPRTHTSLAWGLLINVAMLVWIVAVWK